MEMTNSIIEKINEVFKDIQTLEKDVKSVSSHANLTSLDAVKRLEIGSKILRMNELNTKLFTLLEIIDENEFNLLSSDILDYYAAYIELKKPISDADSEDIKKFKEEINKLKNGKS